MGASHGAETTWSLGRNVQILRASGKSKEAWELTTRDPEVDRVIRKVARRYIVLMEKPSGLFDDAVQEGRIALVKAVEGWDPQRGEYINYVRSKARAAITKFLGYNGGVIRTSKSMREHVMNLNKALRMGDKIESTEDVMRILELTKPAAHRVYEFYRRPRELSVEESRSEDGKRTLLDVLKASNNLGAEVLSPEVISDLLSQMKAAYIQGDARAKTDRNWTWFALYYGIREEEGYFLIDEDTSQTYEAIASTYGVKRNVVHSAVARLSEFLQSNGPIKRTVKGLLLLEEERRAEL